MMMININLTTCALHQILVARLNQKECDGIYKKYTQHLDFKTYKIKTTWKK
jgi:hypothetical protein